ncbi:DUF4178 domain-containing protein [Bailinhaonella thermotolerans]|uniref:DUF4178 domain-containing protein n=1 Tax=Bailinhaonella thermotolerans TaxID=1070861 RepID=A0A3A4ATX3_9ACTN|nr:DUF4178 domain-containing protein [Bailinhaonella thermotolerans]RJL33440.1 DUF4178 domain-containing protein [Bailinhaonella thermotolerans]
MTASLVVIALSSATFLVVTVAWLTVRAQDRDPPPHEAAPPPPEPEPVPRGPDPRGIGIGDVIDCQGARWFVIGVLHMEDGDQRWREFLLDDGAGHYTWLTVEQRGGGLEVVLWMDAPSQGMIPPQRTVLIDGVEYVPVERGTAAFRSEGSTGHADSGWIDYADYRSPEGRYLSFERVRGRTPWTASYGRPLPPGSIAINP